METEITETPIVQLRREYKCNGKKVEMWVDIETTAYIKDEW